MSRKPIVAVEAEIHDLTHDGKGVAAAAGKAVFVAGALPGETVEYQRTKRRRKYDEATTIRVITASEHRVEPRCEVFGTCGGCSLQHLAHERQVAHKHTTLLENLRRLGKVEPEFIADPMTGPQWHYRRKARLGAKFVVRKDTVLVGFRERFKPYITVMSSCPVLEKPLQQLPGLLAELIGELSVREQCPQIEVAMGDNATALVFRILAATSREDNERLKRFGELHNFQIYLQTGGLDSVRPLGQFMGVSEVPELYYDVDDGAIRLNFQATDFVQINREINERLVASAIALLDVGPKDRVLDLYCGIGNFSLPLARRAASVHGIEGAADLVARARENARFNNLENVSFEMADLEKLDGSERWHAQPWDLVLLDPARVGAAALVPFLAKISPRRIVYVSCHPGTLARDVGLFVNEHGFRFRRAGIVDMFPHTAHVESIAVLESPT